MQCINLLGLIQNTETRQLKPRNSFLTEVQDQGVSMFCFSWGFFHSLAETGCHCVLTWLLLFVLKFLMSLPCLIGILVGWVKTPPMWSHLTLIISLKILSPNSVTSELYLQPVNFGEGGHKSVHNIQLIKWV